MSELEYEEIEWSPEDKILSAVFDKSADQSVRVKLIFSAAYYQEATFFIELARRGLGELEPDLRNKLLDAIDGYMGSRSTTKGVESLMPLVYRFSDEYGDAAYPGTSEIIADIEERLGRNK